MFCGCSYASTLISNAPVNPDQPAYHRWLHVKQIFLHIFALFIENICIKLTIRFE